MYPQPTCSVPIVDEGFSLQYSPLLVYREGSGFVLFCQMDVNGRRSPKAGEMAVEPAAQRLAANIVSYVAGPASAGLARPRTLLYAGGLDGRKHLQDAGFTVADFAAEGLNPDQVLVVAPGGAQTLAPHRDAISVPVTNTSGDETVQYSLPWAVVQANSADDDAVIDFQIPAADVESGCRRRDPAECFSDPAPAPLVFNNASGHAITIDGAS